jgi:hypothetical protein
MGVCCKYDYPFPEIIILVFKHLYGLTNPNLFVFRPLLYNIDPIGNNSYCFFLQITFKYINTFEDWKNSATSSEVIVLSNPYTESWETCSSSIVQAQVLHSVEV